MMPLFSPHAFSKTMSVSFIKIALLASLFGASTLLHANDDAMALLNRMNHALHQLSYTGTLAYLRGNTLSTLHIEHLVNNGVEAEHVIRMDEAGNIAPRELNGFSLASIPQIRPEMLKVYSFDMGRQHRVANIPCTIVTARPKDRERYLQKYCINLSTGMLLDYMLVNKSHKAVEQFMFTTIDIQMPVSTDNVSAEVMPAVAVEKRSYQRISNENLDDGWVMEALPAGYEISQAPLMEQDISNDVSNNNSVTKHYIISDGLSSLSVFVSPLTDDAPSDAVYLNSGALNVVTQQKGGQMITVVGEVPESTLKRIIDNMSKK